MKLNDTSLLLIDFRDWSGGLDPHEVKEYVIYDYINNGLPGAFDEDKALEILLELNLC